MVERDQRVPRERVLDHRCPHPEHLRQQLGGQHLPRLPGGDQRAPVQHVQPVAHRGRRVQVVQRDQRGAALLPQQRQQLHLVPDVQVVGRLVQHQDVRLLRQRPRQQNPLPLPAGELGEPPVRRVRHADPGQRLGHQPVVLGVVLGERPLVRGPAHRDHLAHGQLEVAAALLGQRPDVPGRLRRTQLRQLPPGQQHPPGTRPQMPVDGAQQTGLAAAVGTDQAGDLALLGDQVDTGHHGPPGEGDTQVFDGDSQFRSSRRSSR